MYPFVGDHLAQVVRRLRVSLAAALANTVLALLSTSKPNRLGLVAVLPQTATGAAVPIAMSIPLARAVGVLPMTDLDLAVGTVAGAVNVQTAHLAVQIHTHAIRVLLDGDIVVLVASPVGMVVALEF